MSNVFELLVNRIDALSRGSVVTLAGALGLVVVALDHTTGSEISFSLFYVVPVALLAWRFDRTVALAAALLAATAWYVVELIGDRVYTQPLIPMWNGFVRFGFFAIIAELLAVLKLTLGQHAHDARTDNLTGLLNRRGFIERAEVEMARFARSGNPFSLAYFDLDSFKLLNDSAGHAAGDDLLRKTGTAMIQHLRRSDVTARIGGDEFAVLLPDTGSDAVRLVIDRLREDLEVLAAGTGVGFSIGVVTFESQHLDLEQALGAADSLMYSIKKAGGRSVLYRTEPSATRP